MSLKLIVAFGNVIPERNVKVKLKLCLWQYGSQLWQLRAQDSMRRGLGCLGEESDEGICLEATLIIGI